MATWSNWRKEMVKITVFIEGGILPGDNTAVQTIDNSEKFRESFRKIFNALIPNDQYELDITPSGPNKQAIKFFQQNIEKGLNAVLLIDLDDVKGNKNNKIEEFGITLGLNNIFFMVQEMEAWILSQTGILDTYGQQEGFIRKRVDELISEDTLIRNIDPEDIIEPSKKLNTIFRKYFSISKVRNGRTRERPKSYGKLKDAPGLIELLNVCELINTFEDIQHMKDFFRRNNHSNY